MSVHPRINITTVNSIDTKTACFDGVGDYDPSLQRFLGEDPIGFESKDTNWYRYTWNNPVNLVDSDGLSGKKSDIAKDIIYCAKNPKKCRKTVCNKLNSLMHTVCDKPGLSCKGNDTYITLQLKRARLQTCLMLRDAVTFCHGRAKDPNPAGHNRQKEQTRRRIEDCKKKLNKCDAWF